VLCAIGTGYLTHKKLPGFLDAWQLFVCALKTGFFIIFLLSSGKVLWLSLFNCFACFWYYALQLIEP